MFYSVYISKFSWLINKIRMKQLHFKIIFQFHMKSDTMICLLFLQLFVLTALYLYDSS